MLGQRQQERHRRDEVRGEHVEQQRALAQRLAHEPEVALLEVAQPAVDELRSSGDEVPEAKSRASTSATSQPARGGVERGARRRSPRRRSRRRRRLVAHQSGRLRASGCCAIRVWLACAHRSDYGYGAPDGGLRRRDRPGHDEHALHPLRPRRADRARRPARARADHPKAGWVEHDPRRSGGARAR